MTMLRRTWAHLARDRALHATCIGILSLALAANAVVFSAVSALLLRDLPFPRAEELVTLGERSPQGGTPGLVSFPVLAAWQSRPDLLKVAGFTQGEQVLIGATPVSVGVTAISGEFFGILGQTASLGRLIGPEDDRIGGQRVAVLGYQFWQSRFGARPSIVGSMVSLGGESHLVIGIASPSFLYPRATEVWTALMPGTSSDYLNIPTAKILNVVARKSVDSPPKLQVALNELTSVTGNTGWTAHIRPLRDTMVGEVRRPLIVLMGSVAFVLLIACLNVASLLLTKTVHREQEAAVRAALGATRWRLVRDVLMQSMLLIAVSGVFGLAIVYLLLDAVIEFLPSSYSATNPITLDYRVVAFTGLAGAITALFSGALPAWQGSRVTLTRAITQSGRGLTSVGGIKGQMWLAVFETGLSLVLLVGAGLLLRSLARLIEVDPGFDSRNVHVMEVKPPEARYPWAEWQALFRELQERTLSIPGVVSVATAKNVPLDGTPVSTPIVVEGGVSLVTNDPASVTAVSPTYFRTLGIRLREGRDFEERDEVGDVPVAVVSESFARRFFPGRSPIGRKVRPFFGGTTMREIVGVVDDVRMSSLRVPNEPALYTLAAHQAAGSLLLVVKAESTASALPAALGAILRELDRELPVEPLVTLEERLGRQFEAPRLMAVMVAGFAGLAAVLSILGVYSVTTQLVAQSRREAAIRLAVGADERRIIRLLLSRGLRIVVAGAGIGLIGATGLTRILGSLLYGVGAFDGVTFIVATAIIVIGTGSAVAIAAIRITSLPPMHSLAR